MSAPVTPQALPAQDEPVESVRLYRPLRPWRFSDGRVTKCRAPNAPAFKAARRLAETGDGLLLYEVAAHCALDLTPEQVEEYGMDEMKEFVEYVSKPLAETEALLALRAAEADPGEAAAVTTATGSSSPTSARSKRSATASPPPILSNGPLSTSSAPTT